MGGISGEERDDDGGGAEGKEGKEVEAEEDAMSQDNDGLVGFSQN